MANIRRWGCAEIIGLAVLCLVILVAARDAYDQRKNRMENYMEEAKFAAIVRRKGDQGIVVEVIKNDGLRAVKAGDAIQLYGRRDAGREGELIFQLWDGEPNPHFFMELRFRSDGRLATSGYTVDDLRRIAAAEREKVR